VVPSVKLSNRDRQPDSVLSERLTNREGVGVECGQPFQGIRMEWIPATAVDTGLKLTIAPAQICHYYKVIYA